MSFEYPHLSRRAFVKTVAGIAFTVNSFPVDAIAAALGQGRPQEKTSDTKNHWEAGAGKARFRIDGLDKVTGAKIYARDFRAKDLKGWPDTEQTVLIIRALNVDNPFAGLALDRLAEDMRPMRVLYGDEFYNVGAASQSEQTSLNLLPGFAEHPFIVPRGMAAGYYGQPVAFLYYSTVRGYLQAREKIRGIKDFQQYDHSRAFPHIDGLQGKAHIVRTVHRRGDNAFSFVQNGADKDYEKKAGDIEKSIRSEIKNRIWRAYKAHCTMPAIDPVFMEPESGLAWYDASKQTLHVVAGTQSPGNDIEHLLTIFASPAAPAKVRTVNVYGCYLGGGFGGRDRSMLVINLAIAAVYSEGQPVRIAYDRYEQFQSGLKRHATSVVEEVAVDEQGRLQAKVVDVYLDGGGRKNLSAHIAMLAAVCADNAYYIPRTSIKSQASFSTNIVGGSQRGFGSPQVFFSMETLLDDVARDRNLDPFVIRTRNLLRVTDGTVMGGPLPEDLQLSNILDTARHHKLWLNRDTERKKWAREGLLYGVGFAVAMKSFGKGRDGLVAEVYLGASGAVEVVTDAVDMGNGSATTLALSTAVILGCNATVVRSGQGDLFTGLKMQSGGPPQWENSSWTQIGVTSSAASMTAFYHVHAVQQAAQVLFDTAIIPAAQRLWKMTSKPEGLHWDDQHLVSTHSDVKPLSLAQLAENIYQNSGVNRALVHVYNQCGWVEADFRVSGQRHRWAIDGLTVYRAGVEKPEIVRRESGKYPSKTSLLYLQTLYSVCANLVGITVEPKTGRSQLRQAVSILDAGKILCEPLVFGQVQGGLAMGIGYALLEDSPPGVKGAAGGSWNLGQYQVPHADDVPWDHHDINILKPVSDKAPAKGIAEVVMCAVAPAISNALKDATGCRLTDLPMTPAKILKAMQSCG